MARNDNNNHSNRSHDQARSHQKTGSDRDRRRDRVVSTVKERPYAAAALATVAAGAAAFFLTRNKSDKPLMNWGQDSQGDNVRGAGAFKQQGSTTTDASLETTSNNPSSSAGVGAGTGGTSPSAVQAAGLAASGSSTNASNTGGTGTGSSGKLNTGTSSAGMSGASGGRNASDGGKTSVGGKTGSTGLDETAKDQTKVGSVAYGA